MGLSILIPTGTGTLTATIRYGDYIRVEQEEGYEGPNKWRRIPREESLMLELGNKSPGSGKVNVPNSRGVELV